VTDAIVAHPPALKRQPPFHRYRDRQAITSSRRRERRLLHLRARRNGDENLVELQQPSCIAHHDERADSVQDGGHQWSARPQDAGRGETDDQDRPAEPHGEVGVDDAPPLRSCHGAVPLA
jgi:hypothetical protein